jgi:hypothetical protein
MLFSQASRTDLNPKRASESYFEFCERSGRPGMPRIRALIERLLECYPADGRPDIVGRIRSREDSNFRSALFELTVFSSLKYLGAAVQLHPLPGNGKSGRPDFKATFANGSSVYIEATSSAERNGRTERGQRIIETTLEALNSRPHHTFCLDVESSGEPSSQPSAKDLRKKIHSWLDTLDPDIPRSRERSTTSFLLNGWNLTCKAIPLHPERRGSSPSFLRSRMSAAYWTNRSRAIKDAIVSKANKYGPLDAPLIIALNCHCFSVQTNEELDALYGDIQLRYYRDMPSLGSWQDRASNGVWAGASSPAYTGVTGAWIFRDLHLYSLSSAVHNLYINPWARHEIPTEMKQLPSCQVTSNHERESPGVSLHSILGLGDEWSG